MKYLNDFEGIVTDIIDRHQELWTRLAHSDSRCDGEFEEIEDYWFVCSKCGMSYEQTMGRE